MASPNSHSRYPSMHRSFYLCHRRLERPDHRVVEGFARSPACRVVLHRKLVARHRPVDKRRY
jgi:hypothetical protein